MKRMTTSEHDSSSLNKYLNKYRNTDLIRKEGYKIIKGGNKLSEKEMYGDIECPNCKNLAEYWLFEESSNRPFELIFCKGCQKIFLAYPNEAKEGETAPWIEDKDPEAYEEWREMIGI